VYVSEQYVLLLEYTTVKAKWEDQDLSFCLIRYKNQHFV
jgi:hypothetical protein